MHIVATCMCLCYFHWNCFYVEKMPVLEQCELFTKSRGILSNTVEFVFGVYSGHPRSICGAVHPNGPREQKEDQAHRQRHQPEMERDLSLHIRPQPAERPGG